MEIHFNSPQLYYGFKYIFYFVNIKTAWSASDL